MRKIAVILIAVMMVIGLAACGNSEEAGSDSGSAGSSSAAESSAASEGSSAAGGSDVLVVYFSQTGNTKGIAEKIADIEGADIYEIEAAKEYTSDDLNYDDPESRATVEQNDPSARPEIGNEPVSLEGYKKIFIGYPIWWGQEPRIMDTFVESNEFDGITMIPFCTSGSSDIGDSGKNLEKNAGSGNWLDGKRFEGGASEDDVRSWIEGM